MTAPLLAFVLFQAAAATPTPTPGATPTPTPRAVAGPRTLQDVARERRLANVTKKGALGTISLGPSTTASAAKPAAEGTAPPEATPAPTPEAAVDPTDVRVATVGNDGIVDGAGGVRVNGTVRNAGPKPACNVVIAVKILDNHGQYLASGQATPDVAVIRPGDVVSFHTVVQAPPGVRGARTNPDRKDATDGSTSMGGDWKLLGGTEASVASVAEDCVK